MLAIAWYITFPWGVWFAWEKFSSIPNCNNNTGTSQIKATVVTWTWHLCFSGSTESMKRNVMTYYSRCKQVLPGSMKVDQELSLLFTWCFEVISNCWVMCILLYCGYSLRMLLGKNVVDNLWRVKWRSFLKKNCWRQEETPWCIQLVPQSTLSPWIC